VLDDLGWILYGLLQKFTEARGGQSPLWPQRGSATGCSYMDGIVNSWHEMGILQVISFTCILFSHINPTIQIKYRYGNEEWVCSAERSWARKKE